MGVLAVMFMNSYVEQMDLLACEVKWRCSQTLFAFMLPYQRTMAAHINGNC